jgi:DNA-binding response OmpR family regulator
MTFTHRILIVDDDDGLRQTLAHQLSETEGFSVTQAENAAKAISLCRDNFFDIHLLDLGLPDMDGRDLCRRLRAAGVRAPIIMLTAHDGDEDTIMGLEAGATDYLTKPFRFGILTARLWAHLRQHQNNGDAAITLGPYVFEPPAKILTDGKRKIRLTDKEVAILRYLCRSPANTASREALLAEVWGYNAAVTTHTLETHIYRLRQKIEADPAEARIILTAPGGYQLRLGG